MARFTQNAGGTGTELNYVQVESNQVTITTSPQDLVSLQITTTGKPVQVSITGEGSNASAGAWVKLALYRDGTLIGQTIQIEASAVSENVPYALNYIDDVTAGAHIYTAKIVGKSSGNWQFGEVSGPVMNAVELTGFKGDTGAQGPQGEPGAQGEAGTDATGGLVYLGDYVSGNGYIADIAVVRGSDNNLYIAKQSGGLMSPIANPGQWDMFSDNSSSGTGPDLVIPFIMKDENGNDLLGFEKGGTGVTRINALQDDLALRSSNDIILYPGDDGPGNVYIGWGDATYTPDATNRVATIADIQSANIADFEFTDNYNDTGNSGISLPGDKGMTIAAGEDSDLFLTAGDDLYIQTFNDDIHIQANDDIRFTSNYQSGGTEQYWRMNSEGRFEFPGNGYIENVVDGSGDGYNNDTLKLVPDDDLVSGNGSDQYLIIDPTSPNHIHIRAGGTQDESSAHIIVGGEKNNVEVSDVYRTVQVHSRQQQQSMAHLNTNFESSDYLTTTDVVSATQGWTIQVDNVSYYISSVQQDYPMAGITTIYAPGAPFVTSGVYNVFSPDSINTWQFASNGTLYGPAMGGLKVSGIVNDGDQDLWISASNADISINATDNVASINAANINITSNNNTTINTLGGDRTWNFTDGGALYGPAEDSHLEVAGIRGENGHPTMFIGPESIVLDGNNGEFLNDPNVPGNQIATIGNFETAYPETDYTVGGGTDGTQPTFTGNPLFFGSYTKTSNLVHFRVNVQMTNITNFGSGNYYITLPHNAKYDTYMRNGHLRHSSGDIYAISGHVTAGTNVLALYSTASNGKEVRFTPSVPVGLNASCDFHIFGSYFSA